MDDIGQNASSDMTVYDFNEVDSASDAAIYSEPFTFIPASTPMPIPAQPNLHRNHRFQSNPAGSKSNRRRPRNSSQDPQSNMKRFQQSPISRTEISNLTPSPNEISYYRPLSATGGGCQQPQISRSNISAQLLMPKNSRTKEPTPTISEFIPKAKTSTSLGTSYAFGSNDTPTSSTLRQSLSMSEYYAGVSERDIQNPLFRSYPAMRNLPPVLPKSQELNVIQSTNRNGGSRQRQTSRSRSLSLPPGLSRTPSIMDTPGTEQLVNVGPNMSFQQQGNIRSLKTGHLSRNFSSNEKRSRQLVTSSSDTWKRLSRTHELSGFVVKPPAKLLSTALENSQATQSSNHDSRRLFDKFLNQTLSLLEVHSRPSAHSCSESSQVSTQVKEALESKSAWQVAKCKPEVDTQIRFRSVQEIQKATAQMNSTDSTTSLRDSYEKWFETKPKKDSFMDAIDAVFDRLEMLKHKARNSATSADALEQK